MKYSTSSTGNNNSGQTEKLRRFLCAGNLNGQQIKVWFLHNHNSLSGKQLAGEVDK